MFLSLLLFRYRWFVKRVSCVLSAIYRLFSMLLCLLFDINITILIFTAIDQFLFYMTHILYKTGTFHEFISLDIVI